MTAYYNEIDPHAAAWLRALIAAGHIAPGVVDERSIEDVTPDELRGFTQCHFFAGIGVWSYALRSAGWPDDRPIWTGSCPCQPFSAAGAGAGFADERHLWPTFHHLIAECRPAVVVGEQVASKIIDDWIDLVHADLEALGYAFGSVPFPSAGVGAPHIRDRNYWAANSSGQGLAQRQRQRGILGRAPGADQGETAFGAGVCDAGRLADTAGEGWRDGRQLVGGDDVSDRRTAPERGLGGEGAQGLRAAGDPGPTNGYWADADWLGCRDGKWRPVEPGTFPLAHGPSSSVGRVRADQERLAAIPERKDQGHRAGRLKGYGNAINAEAARIFIECAFPDLEESLI